ncbi:MAG: hypothetical protein V3V48_05700, partial [Candidatus Aminicenantaceae bacterium]
MRCHTKAALVKIALLVAVSISFGFTMVKDKDPVKLTVVLQPVSGSRSGPEISQGPQLMYEGVKKMLAEMGIEEAAEEIVKLTPEE